MKNNQSSVKVAINESSLLRKLGSVFTDKTKVISELLQNGRRAGATAINITFEGNTLVVTDNGCGVEHMQNLLTVADSGWDSQIMSNETPFGMGFLSTLFTAQSVKVQSRGRQISFLTSDAIKMNEIAVESCDIEVGTRVTLEGIDLDEHDIETALVTGSINILPFSSGFSIPIIYNGKVLARPHQLDDRYIDSEIGKIRLFSEIEELLDAGFVRVSYHTKIKTVYLQGLPVNAGDVPPQTVIHLNNEFFARMPDRDVLLNLENASKRITAVVRAEYRRFFEDLKLTHPISLFKIEYFSVIQSFGFLDILNDIDEIPRRFFDCFNDYPVDDSWCLSHLEEGTISRSMLESNDTMVLQDFYKAGELGSKTMALNMLAWKLNWPILKEKFDPDHWVMKLSFPREDDYSNENDRTNCNLDSAVQIIVENERIEGDVTLCDSYTVVYRNKSFTFTEDAVSIGDFGNECSTVIVPSGEHSALVLDQFNSWTDEFDSFDEDWQDREKDLFLNKLAILRGEDSAVTLQKIFDYGDINNSNLLGKAFTVRFVKSTSNDRNEVVIEEIFS